MLHFSHLEFFMSEKFHSFIYINALSFTYIQKLVKQGQTNRSEVIDKSGKRWTENRKKDKYINMN